MSDDKAKVNDDENKKSVKNANPASEEDKTPANYQLGGYLKGEVKYKFPAHSLDFDEQLFLKLLAGSISLSKDEKLKILNSVSRLNQHQIDELIKIFNEEKRRFAELSEKHVPQLKKLEEKHKRDWDFIISSQAQESKQEEEKKEADDIRKQLGL